MKLWDKGFSEDEKIDRFTVGHDREMDMFLAPYDILGTMAHITMLESVGLLEKSELDVLLVELKKLYKIAEEGKFVIDDDVEDIHSQVELLLTKKLGDIGKKVHTGRSRNDQVMVDLKLFSRDAIEKAVIKIKSLFDVLQRKSEMYKNVLIPGYTHLQVAMPSSFGLWFGAYAESLADDMLMMLAAWEVTDQNPLGAAAGYGSSAPINRTMTTRLLGFDDLDYNVVYAQMGRGKTERIISFALASVAETVGRLAVDGCLFASQNFGFIHLPDRMTTGSSIMPHKKNPDVFELIRAHCNKIQGASNTIRLITGNLPSGYFRDMQIIKEVFIPLFDEIYDCLDIASYAVENMEVVEDVMDDPKYKFAFSVEEVNHLVSQGVPFRDAYRQVGDSVQKGTFEYHGKLHHTHEGSIGNLCNDKIRMKMDNTLKRFSFRKMHDAVDSLTK
ncbi:MAG: argininosuccinate lyase [Bacteroidales bacterium]|jgi:argininosuccinate lyase|nr:argininosuccinate lyase [Bacteroidales bacterium]MCI1785212.1 argininosuccinate lyase [Bacteroidales bacterium]